MSHRRSRRSLPAPDPHEGRHWFIAVAGFEGPAQEPSMILVEGTELPPRPPDFRPAAPVWRLLARDEEEAADRYLARFILPRTKP